MFGGKIFNSTSNPVMKASHKDIKYAYSLIKNLTLFIVEINKKMKKK
jgi:hypothetical protein